jgi:hypothetical protein
VRHNATWVTGALLALGRVAPLARG